MNTQLLNPFAHDTPDTVEATLEHASASCIRFNHGNGLFAGHYLAAGRTDGVVTIWDIETKGLLRWFEGHVKVVSAIAWSPYSRYLASASFDSNLILWDLATGSGSRLRTLRFDSPVIGVQFSPKSSQILLAVLGSQQIYIVDLRKRIRTKRKRTSSQQTTSKPVNGDGPVRKELVVPNQDDEEDENSSSGSNITAARFSPDGQRVFAGTARGAILVFDVDSSELVGFYNAFGSSAIRELAFDKAGRNLVLNCQDRTIRILTVDTRTSPAAGPDNESHDKSSKQVQVEINLLHRFQDLVNRTPWTGIGFSGDGEYVFGGAAHKVAHNIYIWDRAAGALDKILEGPREPLIDVDWHPSRPLLASASTSGNISLWFTPSGEIWSAYAPGFEELEENVVYEEREDEFDLEDEEAIKRRKLDEEEAPVDIWLLGPAASARLADGEEDTSGVLSSDANGARSTEAGRANGQSVKMEVDGADDAEVDTPSAAADQGKDDDDEGLVWVFAEDEDYDETFVIHVRLEDEMPELGSDDGRDR